MKKLTITIIILFSLFSFTIAYKYNDDQVLINFKLLNDFRESNGLNKLTFSNNLSECGKKFLEWQIDNNHIGHYIDENHPTMGHNPYDRCGHIVNGGIGENLISSMNHIPGGAKAFELRKNSPSHRKNMLIKDWKYVGIATVTSDDGKNTKWIQLFTDEPTNENVDPTPRKKQTKLAGSIDTGTNTNTSTNNTSFTNLWDLFYSKYNTGQNYNNTGQNYNNTLQNGEYTYNSGFTNYTGSIGINIKIKNNTQQEIKYILGDDGYQENENLLSIPKNIKYFSNSIRRKISDFFYSSEKKKLRISLHMEYNIDKDKTLTENSMHIMIPLDKNFNKFKNIDNASFDKRSFGPASYIGTEKNRIGFPVYLYYTIDGNNKKISDIILNIVDSLGNFLDSSKKIETYPDIIYDFTIKNDIKNPKLQEAISWMYEIGLTSYKTIEDFIPNKTITREEAAKFFSVFAKKLVNMTEKEEMKCQFYDKNKINSTLIEDVKNSCKLGIFRGSDMNFFPKDKLTYAEAITLLMRIIVGDMEEPFGAFYANYLQYAKSLGIVNGTPKANKNITRGEVALLLYKAYNYLQMRPVEYYFESGFCNGIYRSTRCDIQFK